MPSGMKGLTSFVSDIRNCSSKDAERKRVEKELAKIRVKFTGADAKLSGYDRKKYVWKLLYAYMLGYVIDFGHIQAINLCSSVKYSEKLAGYLACALLLSDSPDVLRLIVNVCKADLQSTNDCTVALALHTLANIGSADFAENLFTDVTKLFAGTSGGRGVSVYVKRKAALCLLRLHRRDPSELLIPEEWAPRLVTALGEKDVGLLTSTASLFVGILEAGVHSPAVWADCLRPVVLTLSAMVTGDCPTHYMYYGVPAPWLQVRLLRSLQFFPPESIDEAVLFRVNEILARIVGVVGGAVGGAVGELVPVIAPVVIAPGMASPEKKNPKSANGDKLNRSNAETAILFEAINVVIHLDNRVDREVRRNAATLLGKFISAKEANTRYLGLESMARLAQNMVNADVVLQASEHKLFDKFKTVVASQLHEPDSSIRRQALNLLYVICDKGNWQGIVDELLEVLSRGDPQLEEELVLKVAILAEENAPDPTWYVDVVFKMLEYAPESVGEEVWFRVVQIVANSVDGDPSVPLHAATKAYEALGGTLARTTYPHDSMMRLSSYLLGEFGHHLVHAKKVSSLRIVELLRKHFPRMSSQCKGITLMSWAKILNASPNNKPLRDDVCMHIEGLKDSSDPDLQQRSCELLYLINKGNDVLLEQVLAMMPPPTQTKGNPLVQRLKLHSAKTRATTRQTLEVAAVSEGGVYKASQANQVARQNSSPPKNTQESSSDESE